MTIEQELQSVSATYLKQAVKVALADRKAGRMSKSDFDKVMKVLTAEAERRASKAVAEGKMDYIVTKSGKVKYFAI